MSRLEIFVMNKTLSAILLGCLLSNPLYAVTSNAPLTGFITVGETLWHGSTYNNRSTSAQSDFNFVVTKDITLGFHAANYNSTYLKPSLSYKLPIPLDTSIKASWWADTEDTNTSYLEVTGKVSFAIEKAKMDVTLDYAPSMDGSKKYYLCPELNVSRPLISMLGFVGSVGYEDFEDPTEPSSLFGTAGVETSYKSFTAAGKYVFKEKTKPIIVWSITAKF